MFQKSQEEFSANLHLLINQPIQSMALSIQNRIINGLLDYSRITPVNHKLVNHFLR